MDEVKDKSGKDIDVSLWEKEFVDDLPEQENGCVDSIIFFIAFSLNNNGREFFEQRNQCNGKREM